MERIAKTVLDTIPAIARELEALVWRQELGCSVLVSTSVLDNGISLHADSVDHLVLCQPGKTSFLQMLGRVRVREGQRLKVYIQRQTPKQVKGYIDQCKKDILFLIRWKLNGKRVPRSMFNGNNRDIAFIPFIDETSALQRERLENEHRPKYLVSRKDGIEEANLLVIYQLLGNLYDMEVRAKAQGTEDPNFYIRSRQPGKTKQGSRESYWTIEKRNEAKEAEHPLQDAPTLTDSQDTSGGSCSPSSGTPAV